VSQDLLQGAALLGHRLGSVSVFRPIAVRDAKEKIVYRFFWSTASQKVPPLERQERDAIHDGNRLKGIALEVCARNADVRSPK